MRRRRHLSLGIILGLLIAIVLLLGPLAPLLVRLGVEPVCIQGTFPGLHIVPCPDSASSEEFFATDLDPTDAPPTAVSYAAPIPLIFDDDGSPDGMIALLYFLQHPAIDVVAVTISSGEAHAEHFADLVSRLLAGLGYGDIPVGYGSELPLSGNNAFPDPWRASTDEFWGISLPEGNVRMQPQPATDVLLDVLNQAPEPVLVFVSGTHTNLAEALSLDPGIAGNISSIAVMGGAIHVPGNIASDWPEIDNTVAEWNIWVDPTAAQQVFNSGIPIQLVPLDGTNQVVWTPEDAALWRSSEHLTGRYAADLLSWMLNSWFPEGVYAWDLVTAIAVTDTMLCAWENLAIDVVLDPGPDQGWTRSSENPPNAEVCLQPVATGMKARAGAILGP